MSWSVVFFVGLALAVHWFFIRPKIVARRKKSLYGKTEFDDTVRTSKTYSLEVVGESRYQRNLEAIVGGRKEDSARKVVDVLLFPESNNKFDENAVRVDSHEMPVGYLSKEDAKKYREKYGQKGAKCRGVIVGGWDRGDGDTGSFGIKLNFKI
jgi:hypothetical protein